jgi:hypothetical protein
LALSRPDLEHLFGPDFEIIVGSELKVKRVKFLEHTVSAGLKVTDGVLTFDLVVGKHNLLSKGLPHGFRQEDLSGSSID